MGGYFKKGLMIPKGEGGNFSQEIENLRHNFVCFSCAKEKNVCHNKKEKIISNVYIIDELYTFSRVLVTHDSFSFEMCKFIIKSNLDLRMRSHVRKLLASEIFCWGFIWQLQVQLKSVLDWS